MAERDSVPECGPGSVPPPDPPEAIPEAAPPGEAERWFRVSPSAMVTAYALLLTLTIIGVILALLLLPSAVSARDFIVCGMLGLWALALIHYWVFVLSMPYRLCLRTPDRLTLHALLRKKEISCREIDSLRVSALSPRYLRIVPAKGRSVAIFNHIDGLHDLISRIRQANPEIETRGC